MFVLIITFGAPHVAEPPGAEPPSPDGVHDPVEADEIDWDDDTLVIGVAIEDEARAYPVNALNRREIVNDRIADTPLLASW